MRAGLCSLILLATVGFVIGTSVERDNENRESAAEVKAEKAAAPKATVEATADSDSDADGGAEGHATAPGGKAPAEHASESGEGAPQEVHEEEAKPLGVDVESTPLIMLAVLVSVALAVAAWLRPDWVVGLCVVAVAMVLFGALDIREVFRQGEESRAGLAVLAAVIAALHFASAAVAATMIRRRALPTSRPTPAR